MMGRRTSESIPSLYSHTMPGWSCKGLQSRVREGRPGSDPSASSRSKGALPNIDCKQVSSTVPGGLSRSSSTHPWRWSALETIALVGCRGKCFRWRCRRTVQQPCHVTPLICHHDTNLMFG
jgi:hypothetical protein